MTIPSSRSLIFEVKSTGSELAFIPLLRLGLDNFGRLRKTLDVCGSLRSTSEDFGLLRESSEMINKSHAYISEKVGRYSNPPCNVSYGHPTYHANAIKLTEEIVRTGGLPHLSR